MLGIHVIDRPLLNSISEPYVPVQKPVEKLRNLALFLRNSYTDCYLNYVLDLDYGQAV